MYLHLYDPPLELSAKLRNEDKFLPDDVYQQLDRKPDAVGFDP